MFETYEEEKLTVPKDSDFQKFYIEVPRLQDNMPRTRSMKKRYIRNIDFEQKEVSCKEDIIKAVEYLVKTYKIYQPYEYENYVAEAKIDLFKLNGDLRDLQSYFRGQKVLSWSKLEDMIIMQKLSGDLEYDMIVQEKGIDKVTERIQFLKHPDNIYKQIAEQK